MPLRDHFRPPVSRRASWEGFAGMWPMAVVQHLHGHLPPGFVAEPRVRLGDWDEHESASREGEDLPPRPAGERTTIPWAGTPPIEAVETNLASDYEYTVRVYAVEPERSLVAVLALVSPANKAWRVRRNLFVAQYATLLRQGVAVSVVDLVTVRRFNLFAELMAFLGHAGLAAGEAPPPVYAASCRWVGRGKKNYLEACARPLVVGQPLPTIPLWLADDLVLPLDLEPSYEQACRGLRIP